MLIAPSAYYHLILQNHVVAFIFDTEIRPTAPPTIVNDVNMQMDTFNDQDQEPALGPASGPGNTTGANLLVLPGPSSHPQMSSPDQQ